MSSQLIASGVIGANGVVQAQSANVNATMLSGGSTNYISLAVDGVTATNYTDYFVLASILASTPAGSFVMGAPGDGTLTIGFVAADGVTSSNCPVTQFAVFKI